MSRIWANSAQYKRILEILDAYWISEPNELKVRVSMDFIKANGEMQTKEIIWRNPNIPPTQREKERRAKEPEIIDLASFPRDPESIYKEHQKFWDV